MDKVRICLSIGKFDKAFEQMVEELSPVAEVTTVGLSDFSLAGFDIFIGKNRESSIRILFFQAIFRLRTQYFVN